MIGKARTVRGQRSGVRGPCFRDNQNIYHSTSYHLKRPLHVQAICANLFAQIAWRLLQTVQACGASLQVAQAMVWFFLNSFLEHALIELIFWIIYFFSAFRYFSLNLFSNLAFCLFFLFLLLYSVLVTHHSAVSVLYSSINSIKNCRSLSVPLEDIAWSIVLQITTAGTTTRCQLRVIWGLFVQASTQTAQALAACAENIKRFWFHASSLRKRANNTLHCQNICANTLRKLLAHVGAAR